MFPSKNQQTKTQQENQSPTNETQTLNPNKQSIPNENHAKKPQTLSKKNQPTNPPEQTSKQAGKQKLSNQPTNPPNNDLNNLSEFWRLQNTWGDKQYASFLWSPVFLSYVWSEEEAHSPFWNLNVNILSKWHFIK